MNFWGYLLAGMSDLFGWVLNMLPIGNVNTILGTGAAVLFFGIAPLLIYVGSFVNLNVLMLCVGTIISMTIAKIIISIWRWILKLIPAAN
jgi:hypothetical protein